MKPVAFLAVLALGLASAAGAAEGPAGIAFAQAEEGTWWCRDGDSRRAIGCALALCRKQSGGQECHPTRWCMPAGWSGFMVVWLPEFHSTHVVCGLPSQAAVGGALKAICDAGEEFTRCDLVEVIDPDGGASAVADTSWPGPAGRDAAE